MTQGNMPAFPVEVTAGDNGFREMQSGPCSFVTSGLTKRELFAAMAMQGVLAQVAEGENCRVIAADAANLADALLAELAKEAT